MIQDTRPKKLITHSDLSYERRQPFSSPLSGASLPKLLKSKAPG